MKRKKLVLARPENDSEEALIQTAIEMFKALTGKDPSPAELAELRDETTAAPSKPVNRNRNRAQ